MPRSISTLLFAACLPFAPAVAADTDPVATQLRFESCPAVALDVESKPWLSKPLLARLSVSSEGALQNIGVAQSSGIAAVDESFFAWLSACRFAADAPGPVAERRELLVGVRVQRPAVAAATIAARGFKDCRAAAYPAKALRQGLQGTTTVRYFVADDAPFMAAAVIRSSGHAALDYAALAHLVECGPTPSATATVTPVGKTVQVEYRWTAR